jgi:hypothetical protein
MSRRDDALRIAELVGPDGLLLDDPADGWPALGTIVGLDQPIDVALYVAPIGYSHRNRDDVERRFQNPGQNRPIQEVPGRALVYIGLWEGDDPDAPIAPAVLVTADAHKRVGRTTRASVFPRLESLRIARSTGIHIGLTTSGEEIAAFVPELLPAQIDAQTNGVAPDEDRYRHELMAAPATPPAERQRRISTTLARANHFARSVRDAYAGRCAMCGLGLGLVESAHILPVAAHDSVDEVSNGVALCANHHRAFDRHQIWIDPTTSQIRIHPSTLGASSSPADEQFVGTTREHLAVPPDGSQQPHEAFLRARYRHFEDEYAWATESADQ